MKKLIGLLVIVILSSGCAKSPLSRFGSSGGSADWTMDPATFCLTQSEKAQKAVKDFQLSENQYVPFTIWKQLFIKANGVDEAYFKDHIFPTGIQEWKIGTGTYVTYDISYYFKPSDLYLEARGRDTVNIKNSELENVKKQSLTSLLQKEVPNPNVSGKKFDEPHPKFGRIAKDFIFWYEWGYVNVNNIIEVNYSKPVTALKCAEAAALLQTCDPRLEPSGLGYKPALEYGWVSGELPKEKRVTEKECVYGSVNVFTNKLDECLKDCIETDDFN